MFGIAYTDRAWAEARILNLFGVLFRVPNGNVLVIRDPHAPTSTTQPAYIARRGNVPGALAPNPDGVTVFVLARPPIDRLKAIGKLCDTLHQTALVDVAAPDFALLALGGERYVRVDLAYDGIETAPPLIDTMLLDILVSRAVPMDEIVTTVCLLFHVTADQIAITDRCHRRPVHNPVPVEVEVFDTRGDFPRWIKIRRRLDARADWTQMPGEIELIARLCQRWNCVALTPGLEPNTNTFWRVDEHGTRRAMVPDPARYAYDRGLVFPA